MSGLSGCPSLSPGSRNTSGSALNRWLPFGLIFLGMFSPILGCWDESHTCSLCRLQQLDDENSELRSCVPCLRANIERLEEVRPGAAWFWGEILPLG